jgi:serine/threonine-protein kinase HipA
MARVDQLAVWLGGQRVAVLRRTGPGGISCEYTHQALAEHPLGIPLLSCSLPVRRGRQTAWPFVTGLLPEGHHRTSMSRLAGVDGLDALGMLARFGRDVAGALVIAPDTGATDDAGGPPHALAPSLVALSDEDLLADVASLPARTLALHDDSELSLLGLEDKILLVRTVATEHSYALMPLSALGSGRSRSDARSRPHRRVVPRKREVPPASRPPAG